MWQYLSRAMTRRDEFEALTLPVTRPLYAVAVRLTSSGEAEDIVQETFLRAYRTFDNFERGTNAKAWLFTILYSIVRNRRRQTSRRPHDRSLAEMEEKGAAEPPTRGWGSHTEMLRTLDRDRIGKEIARAVREMPEEWQLIFLLVVVEEMPYEEVGRVVDCPVGTVASRLYRARRHLLKSLAPLAPELP